MALYAVFRALGLEIEVLPIMGVRPGRDDLSDYFNFGGLDLQSKAKPARMPFDMQYFKKHGFYFPSGKNEKIYDLKLEYGVRPSDPGDPGHYYPDDACDNDFMDNEAASLDDYIDVETRLKTILRKRKIQGISPVVNPVIVGTNLHDWIETPEGVDARSLQEVVSTMI